MEKSIKILVLLAVLIFMANPLKSQIKDVNLNVSQAGIENCFTNVNTNFNLENIKVFPNPTNGLFSIELNNLESGCNLQVVICNIKGQKVFSEKNTLNESSFKRQIDLSDFPAGTYLMNISVKDKYYTAEIILK